MDNSMLQVGTILRGIYRIDGYLASGGFGNTYLATNIEFDEQVAIKEFYMKGVSLRNEDSSVIVGHPENVEMFEKLQNTFKREAKRLRMLSKKRCDHIIKVYDIFEENKTSYYVMQYIKGKSLADILKAQNKPLEQEWLVKAFLPQMLEALDVIHENRMWHLDIKPSNIMLDNSGNAYLIDFGSSKQVDPASGNSTLSSTLSFTRNYAPFEVQQYDHKKIGPPSDIYSLGATLYNLSTNQVPPTAYDIMNEGLSVFKFVPGTSRFFMNLVIWMMRNRTEDRPQSVTELKNSLKIGKVPVALFDQIVPAASRSEDTIPKNENTVPKRDTKSKLATRQGAPGNNNNKRRLLIAGIAVALVAGIGWGIYNFMGKGGDQTDSIPMDSIAGVTDSTSTVTSDVPEQEQPNITSDKSEQQSIHPSVRKSEDILPLTPTTKGIRANGSDYYNGSKADETDNNPNWSSGGNQNNNQQPAQQQAQQRPAQEQSNLRGLGGAYFRERNQEKQQDPTVAPKGAVPPPPRKTRPIETP